MCGIIGYVGEQSAGSILIKGLKTLEYRGYDSFGVALLNGNKIIDIKTAVGAIGEASIDLRAEATLGIGHTRWATHGGVTEENAHPHNCSCGSDNAHVAVVHNGILTNYIELREELKEKGHTFYSETDTECIPHMIEAEYQDDPQQGYIEAIRKTVLKLKGSFAFVAINNEEPDKLYFAKNKSPLVLGIGENENFISSGEVGFLEYTRQLVPLNDMTFGVMYKNEITLFDVETGESIDFEIRVSKWSMESAKKGGYPHFMLKELHEQPKAILNTIEHTTGEAIQKIVSMIMEAKEIYFVASGTSLHSCMSAEMLMLQIAKQKTRAIMPDYLEMQPLDSNSLIIAVSQSGETADVISALDYAKKNGAKIASIVNNMGTQIPRMSDETLYTQAGPEIGVAATKTFTCQVAALTKLALEFALKKEAITKNEYEEMYDELIKIPDVIKEILRRSEYKCKEIGKKIRYVPSVYFLGSATTIPVALEGALKLKEISYIHAEGYNAAESKHGPIALIEKDFPVFFCISDDHTAEHLVGSIQEMKARGATVIGIHPSIEKMNKILDESIEYTPFKYSYLDVIPQAVILQTIAYYTAAGKRVNGKIINPDKPKNLAKSVTVM